MGDTNWYQGTADAVRKQLREILSRRRRQCLILSGDHLYRMDYRAFVEEHREFGADVSIAVKPVTRDQAFGLGILKIGADGRVLDFREKPTSESDLDEFQQISPPGSDPRELYLASMGVYVFEPEVLTSLLLGGDSHDFGAHIIPEAISKLNVHAFSFDGYWADIGTIQSFYQANLGLTDAEPRYEFYRPDWPIYTHQRHLAASRIQGCRIEKGIIAEGCLIGDAEIERCVIGVRTIVESGVRLYNSVVMGADYYESVDDRARNIRILGSPTSGWAPAPSYTGPSSTRTLASVRTSSSQMTPVSNRVRVRGTLSVMGSSSSPRAPSLRTAPASEAAVFGARQTTAMESRSI